MMPTTENRSCLYDAAQLDIVIDRMASQALHLFRGQEGKTAVVGIRRRGAPLADLLTERMVAMGALAMPLRLDLLVKRYADDLTLLHPMTRLTEDPKHVDLDLTDYRVLLVDDVLYTGHSLLKVVDYLIHKQAFSVRFAALVDRGVTRLPVHADVVGVRLDVAPSDIIECHVPPYEIDFKIELVQPIRTA
jgi:pyrimidine operon attenuation protein / uracil phosphoribosyltransferase